MHFLFNCYIIFYILGSSNETQICGDRQGDARVGHPQECDPGYAESCLPPRGPGQAALIPKEGARGRAGPVQSGTNRKGENRSVQILNNELLSK